MSDCRILVNNPGSCKRTNGSLRFEIEEVMDWMPEILFATGSLADLPKPPGALSVTVR